MAQPLDIYLTCHDQNCVLSKRSAVFQTNDLSFEAEKQRVCAYESISFQTWEGFGGAFTQSSATVFAALDEAQKDTFLRAFFSKERGAGYTICRTHLGSCDFSVRDYTCTDVAGDVALAHFSVEEERETLFPFILRAQREAGRIQLLVSPWSPPAWMKDTGRRLGGGRLLPEYYHAWAECIARYILAYRAAGLEIWGVSAQNEAGMAQRFESCVYTPEEEAEFIGGYLGPCLRRHGLEDVRILFWDYNKHLAFERATRVLADTRAAAYIGGLAVHWYSGDHFEALNYVNQRFPELPLYATEACTVVRPGQDRVADAQHYAHDIIGDMNAGVRAFIDWNLLLNDAGGPAHSADPCNAAVQTADGELVFYPLYDYILHFSRFIRPGAVRIGASSFSPDVECTVWRNPDGKHAAVLLNRLFAPHRITYACERGTVEVELPARSLATLAY